MLNVSILTLLNICHKYIFNMYFKIYILKYFKIPLIKQHAFLSHTYFVIGYLSFNLTDNYVGKYILLRN